MKNEKTEVKIENKKEYKTPKLTLKYRVLDMKKIDPDVFIRSRKPAEVILGVLAGKFKDKPQIINKIKRRIVEIVKNGVEIAKYIDIALVF